MVCIDGWTCLPSLIDCLLISFSFTTIFFFNSLGPFCDSIHPTHDAMKFIKKILVITISLALVSTKEWNMCPYNPQAIPFWHDILMLLLRKQLQRDFPLMVFLKPINEASFYSWSSRFPSSRTCHKSKVSQEKLLSLVTMLRFDLTCLQPNFFWEIVQRSTLDCHL